MNTDTVGKLSDYKDQINNRLDKEQEKMEYQYEQRVEREAKGVVREREKAA